MLYFKNQLLFTILALQAKFPRKKRFRSRSASLSSQSDSLTAGEGFESLETIKQSDANDGNEEDSEQPKVARRKRLKAVAASDNEE